jgi:hypothetical protein
VPKLTISSFDGLYPRTSATLLQLNQATVASDVNLYAGELRPWGAPVLEFSPANGGPVYTIFKVYNNAGLSTWLTWAGLIDIVLGPLADTTEIRLYYTDGVTPRKTNYALATGGAPPYPSAWLNMGVPKPMGNLTVGITAGGSLTAETRAYVYTYISTFGTVKEESAPSPASGLITLAISDAVQLSGWTTAPTTNYNITSIRIYRTIAGATTGTNYAYVDEVSVNPSTGVVVSGSTSVGGVVLVGSTYTDNLTAVQLGDAIPSTTWAPPPVGLTGIIAMPNGMLAGFVGNQVYFSEPFFPHSWPLAYAQTVNDNIVGLGNFGSSLVVCTVKYPYILSGASPSTVSAEQCSLPEPCISKLSIVSDDMGVTYASPNGLVNIGYYARGVTTHKLYRRKEWQVNVPSTLFSRMYDGRYVGFYNNGTVRQALILTNDDIPALATKNTSATAAFVDVTNGYLYYASLADNLIYRLDANTGTPGTFTWTSKRFLGEHGETWSALKVDADYSTAGTVTVILMGDGGVTQATLMVSSIDPVRVPPFRARELQIQISAVVAVRSLVLATSIPELR